MLIPSTPPRFSMHPFLLQRYLGGLRGHTRTHCATPISGVVSFAFHTAALIQTDLLRSAQLIFHPSPSNAILLCISHRTIFCSICTPHLPLLSDPPQSANAHSHILAVVGLSLYLLVRGGRRVTDMSRPRILLSLSLSLFSQHSYITWHPQFLRTARSPHSLHPHMTDVSLLSDHTPSTLRTPRTIGTSRLNSEHPRFGPLSFPVIP